MTDPATIRARADVLLREEVKILRVKRRLLRILLKLPDDDARARVLGAAAVLLGCADWRLQ